MDRATRLAAEGEGEGNEDEGEVVEEEEEDAESHSRARGNIHNSSSPGRRLRETTRNMVC